MEGNSFQRSYQTCRVWWLYHNLSQISLSPNQKKIKPKDDKRKEIIIFKLKRFLFFLSFAIKRSLKKRTSLQIKRILPKNAERYDCKRQIKTVKNQIPKTNGHRQGIRILELNRRSSEGKEEHPRRQENKWIVVTTVQSVSKWIWKERSW